MAEKALEEVGNDAGQDDKDRVTNAILELKNALNTEDTAEIEAKSHTLEQAAMKIGEIAYRKAQEKAAAAGGTESAGGASPKDPENNAASGDTIDADFTLEDDDNK